MNVFHGHVVRGRMKVGSFEVDYPAHPHDEPRPATAFVRSHELELLAKRNGRPSLEGKVVHVSPAGPVVRARVFAADFGVVLNVDVTRDRYAELGLEVGDTVYVAPRDVRVYLQDYII